MMPVGAMIIRGFRPLDSIHDSFPLVGFLGLKGHGKSTAAQALTGLGYVQGHPAHTLREMLVPFLRDACGLDESMAWRYLDGPLKREPLPHIGVSATHLQQTLGTEWGRNQVASDIWLRILTRRMEGRRYYNDSIRFHNEADFIASRGGVLIRIVRDTSPSDILDTHISESEQLSIPDHWSITNSGTKLDLALAVLTVMRYVQDELESR